MRAVRTLLVATLIVTLAGCAAAVVGAALGAGAGYTWFNGNLQDTLARPLPAVERATRQALHDLELVGIHGRADRLKGKLKARMADGTRVTVWLKAVDFETTDIRIRVGTLGDRVAS